MKPYAQFSSPRRSLHALAGQIVLENAGCSRNVAAVVGSHHGRPPLADEATDGEEDAQQSNFCVNKAGKPAWDAVRAQIVAYAMELSGYQTFDEMPTPDIAAQVLLSGLVIMTDWIASNEAYFPYIGPDEPVRVGIGRERARAAANKLDFLKTAWCPDCPSDGDTFFGGRFGFAPRALQSAAIRIALSVAQPGIFIIEAPMGIGKTEAALAVAEIFAWAAGRSGVFFALPTQATSDGMFPRLLRWIGALDDPLHSVELVHGKAQFNDDFRALSRIGGGRGIGQDDEAGAAVYDWFGGRKKAMLADFAVGTVDQLLQLALKQKHIMLRHLALSNKTVIIDECHAYDAYMNVYLKRALMWLGRYRVPVVMLSATLPREKRDELVRAYLGNDGKPCNPKPNMPGHAANAYPLITYTDGDEILYSEINAGGDPLEIGISCIADEDVVALLEGELAGGGCAGIIVNTVSRAQMLADTLRRHFGEETVLLLHSRFTAGDRIARERELRAQLGKPGGDVVRPYRRIVVGTQVIEQSHDLDFDFDIMLSDLCPMDLLLQRLGRLHRHKRSRPAGLERALLRPRRKRRCA